MSFGTNIGTTLSGIFNVSPPAGLKGIAFQYRRLRFALPTVNKVPSLRDFITVVDYKHFTYIYSPSEFAIRRCLSISICNTKKINPDYALEYFS